MKNFDSVLSSVTVHQSYGHNFLSAVAALVLKYVLAGLALDDGTGPRRDVPFHPARTPARITHEVTQWFGRRQGTHLGPVTAAVQDHPDLITSGNHLTLPQIKQASDLRFRPYCLTVQYHSE